MRVKSLIDTQAHTHTVFAQAATHTHKISMRTTICTQCSLTHCCTHALLYASAYNLATHV